MQPSRLTHLHPFLVVAPMAPRWVLRTLVRPSLLTSLALAGLLVGCGDRGSNSTPGPTTPSLVATRDVTVVEDDWCYHLGNEARPEFCGTEKGTVFGRPEARWSFTITNQPTEGRLTLHLVDLGPVGATVTLNGTRVMTLPPPLGKGSVTGTIPGSAFRIGSNELRIRANNRAGRADLMEDFQLDQVRLVVTVPA